MRHHERGHIERHLFRHQDEYLLPHSQRYSIRRTTDTFLRKSDRGHPPEPHTTSECPSDRLGHSDRRNGRTHTDRNKHILSGYHIRTTMLRPLVRRKNRGGYRICKTKSTQNHPKIIGFYMLQKSSINSVSNGETPLF